MNIRYPIYEGVYRILTFLHRLEFRVYNLFHICPDFFVSSHGNASVGIWQ